MDSRLDDLIAAAAPATAQRTSALRRELDALVAEAEVAVGSTGSRFGRRVGIASLVVTAVLGLGATASATGVWEPPGWLRADSTLSSGTTCQVAYGAGLSTEPANLESASPAVQATTLAAARLFVAHFDVSTISVDEAVARYRAVEAAQRAAVLREYRAMSAAEQAVVQRKGGPGLGPVLSGDELELRAVQSEFYSRLSAELVRQGLDPKVVEIEETNRCGHEGTAQ